MTSLVAAPASSSPDAGLARASERHAERVMERVRRTRDQLRAAGLCATDSDDEEPIYEWVGPGFGNVPNNTAAVIPP